MKRICFVSLSLALVLQGCSDTSQDVMPVQLGPLTSENEVVDALMGTLASTDPTSMRVGEFVFLEVANEIGGGMARGVLTDVGRTVVARTERSDEIDFTLIETKIEYLEGNTNRKASTEFNFRVPKTAVAGFAGQRGGAAGDALQAAPSVWRQWRDVFTDRWSVSWQGLVDRWPIAVGLVTSRAAISEEQASSLVAVRGLTQHEWPGGSGAGRAEDLHQLTSSTGLRRQLKAMLNEGEAPSDPEPPPARLYGLKVRDLDLPVPGTARSEPNCLGFSGCVYRAREVRFDAMIEFNGRMQRLQRSMVVSNQVPFLARIVQTCDTTMVPIGRGTQRTLLKNCQTVRDFRFEQN